MTDGPAKLHRKMIDVLYPRRVDSPVGWAVSVFPPGEDWQDYRTTDPNLGGAWRPMTDDEVSRYYGRQAIALRSAERVRRAADG